MPVKVKANPLPSVMFLPLIKALRVIRGLVPLKIRLLFTVTKSTKVI